VSDFKQALDLVVKAQADKTLNNNKYRKASLEHWIVQLDLWINYSGSLPEIQVLEKFSTEGLTSTVFQHGAISFFYGN
jgi:exodeoxyribonuclease V beta subunit